ncbi:hypothetical protein GTV15_17100 [Streptomyces sp. SID7803]|nr:hypothetical protein [Streptomyces sp. SID7803]
MSASLSSVGFWVAWSQAIWTAASSFSPKPTRSFPTSSLGGVWPDVG